MKYLCEPCEHRWWQHRHPDRGARMLGLVMMLAGLAEIVIGLGIIWGQAR